MMGHRGESSPQVTALTTLVELLDLAKAADLPARIAELREAEAAARVAWAQVDQKTAEHDAREKLLADDFTELGVGRRDLAVAQESCRVKDEAVARRETALAEREAGLVSRGRAIDEGVRQLAQDRASVMTDFARWQSELKLHSKTTNAELVRLRRGNEAAINDRNAEADAEIAAKHAAADAVIEAAHTELTRREERIIGREEAFERERSRFTALLKD